MDYILGYKRWVMTLIGQDRHTVARSLSPCAQRGRCLFSIFVGMLSQHGFASRDHHVTLSFQMLGMLDTQGYPACMLPDRHIILIITHIRRIHRPLRDTNSSMPLEVLGMVPSATKDEERTTDPSDYD